MSRLAGSRAAGRKEADSRANDLGGHRGLFRRRRYVEATVVRRDRAALAR